MKQITSVYKNGGIKIHTANIELKPDDGSREKYVLNLYPSITKQTFEGFGWAFTEAAGYVYSQLPCDKKRELLLFVLAEGLDTWPPESSAPHADPSSYGL